MTGNGRSFSVARYHAPQGNGRARVNCWIAKMTRARWKAWSMQN